MLQNLKFIDISIENVEHSYEVFKSSPSRIPIILFVGTALRKSNYTELAIKIQKSGRTCIVVDTNDGNFIKKVSHIHQFLLSESFQKIIRENMTKSFYLAGHSANASNLFNYFRNFIKNKNIMIGDNSISIPKILLFDPVGLPAPLGLNNSTTIIGTKNLISENCPEYHIFGTCNKNPFSLNSTYNTGIDVLKDGGVYIYIFLYNK